jgi:hypothetical protein
MTMMVLDFDGNRSVEQVRENFSPWEHVFYTTLNHREDGKDKGRVVMPMRTVMTVDVFDNLQDVIQLWATGLGADSSTADIGRMFILPVARYSELHLAQSWHHEGELFDWSMFSDMPSPATATKSTSAKPLVANSHAFKLMPDDVLETARGNVVVKNIVGKISNVRCPFHSDPTPSEFVNVTPRGTPFLICKKCGNVYMERKKSDGIADGIAQILAKKKLREGAA